MVNVRSGHRDVQKPDGSSPDGWLPFTCGHCGREASGFVVAFASTHENVQDVQVRWLQCPTCRKGSVENAGTGILPGVPFGPTIGGLPDEVSAAYSEARQCLSVNANTAAEGMCRKILMYIAVDKGEKEGKTFADYVDYLESQGYVTPPMRQWVKLIKDHGNEAQHRIAATDRKRAEGSLLFTAQLLRTVYEMGHLAEQFTAPNAP